MVIPSVKILLEYIEPRLAANRHKSETANGIPKMKKAPAFESFSSFFKYLVSTNAAAAAKRLWKSTTKYKSTPSGNALKIMRAKASSKG